MPSYTNIAKPTNSNYTNTNTVGKQQYDQSSITYDDSSIFYDGVNENAYTNIIKPAGYNSLVRGMTVGLLIPLTSNRAIPLGSPYTFISKPN